MSTRPIGQDETELPEAEPALSRVRAERRRRLLDAALAVFLREGYQGASMERVADEAGVSRQTLYNYFDDKEELFLALVEERKIGDNLPRLEAALATIATADTETGLREAVRVMLNHFSEPDMVGLFRLLLEVSGDLPEVMERLRERVFLRGAASVREALERGAESGRLRVVDADVVAHILFGVACSYGLLAPVVLGEHRAPLDRMAAGFADLLAHGLAAPASSGN